MIAKYMSQVLVQLKALGLLPSEALNANTVISLRWRKMRHSYQERVWSTSQVGVLVAVHGTHVNSRSTCHISHACI